MGNTESNPEANASLAAISQSESADVLKKLDTSLNGLSEEEAAQRLLRIGSNAIMAEQRSALVILLEQFRNGLMLLLFGAGVVTIAIGDHVDGAIILAFLFLNTGLGFFQEYRSEQALADLKRMVEVHALVLRNGREVAVPARDLIPGDIVLIKAGDFVPADLRLIEGDEVSVNQAALTGESMWQRKSHTVITSGTSMLSAMSNILFSGTTVMAGRGRGVVVATGLRTAFGRTASLLSNIRGTSDFERALTKFGSTLLWFALFLTAIVFVANALLGRGIITSLTLSLALALGMVPEAMPAVTITALSLGAAVLARKKVIVRRLSAVEDFSAIDILATDKTGTITENRIAVTAIQSLVPQSELLCDALLCSSYPEVGESPIDDALIEESKRLGFDFNVLSKFKVLARRPFTSERKLTSTVASNVSGTKCEIFTKGAAMVVLDRCTKLRQGLGDEDIEAERAVLIEKVRLASESGNRVLAVAARQISPCAVIREADEAGLSLLGFILLADPVRSDVSRALDEAQTLGLKVKIVTGDSRYTALTMAKTLRLAGSEDEVVTGEDLRRASEPGRLAEEANVFAEVVPEDKFLITRALQSMGHHVAVSGDGINDAPALKRADVGIAMASGTDVAKDASDLILLENDLSAIMSGLREGRRIFVNLNRYLVYTMVSNFANVLIVAFASVFVDFLPILPEQVLLLTILADLPMLSLATDRVSPDLLAHHLHWDIRQIIEPAIYLGIVNALFAFGLLRFFLKQTPEVVRTSWYLFLGITAILVLFPVRSRGAFWKGVGPSWQVVTASAAGLFATVLFVEVPVLRRVFGFVELALTAQLAIVGYSLLYVLIAGILLAFYYRRNVALPE
jgi:Mg2+-importing ATPase